MKKQILGILLTAGIFMAGCATQSPTETKAGDNQGQIQAQSPNASTSAGDDVKDDDQNDDKDDDADDQGSGNTTTAESATSPNKGSGQKLILGKTKDALAVTFEGAFDILKKQYPKAQLSSIKLEEDDGQYYYDVDALAEGKEVSMEILASDGSIKEKESEFEDDDKEIIDLTKIISFEEASKLTLAKVSDEASIEEVELDHDEGQIYYTFDLETKADDDLEIKVNATDKTVRVEN